MQTVLGNPFNPQRGGDLQVENQCYRGSGQLQATYERLVTHSLVLIWLWLSASYRAISTELFITGSHKFVVSHISSEMFPKKEWQFEMVMFFFFLFWVCSWGTPLSSFFIFSVCFKFWMTIEWPMMSYLTLLLELQEEWLWDCSELVCHCTSCLRDFCSCCHFMFPRSSWAKGIVGMNCLCFTTHVELE